MSNLIYTDGMYNEDQKNRFITQANISGPTAEGYKIVLKKAATLERQFEKDLFDFNLPEIEQFLKYSGAGVSTAVSNYVSVIKNYIYWAIKEDLRTTNRLNPLNDVKLGLNYYEQFVDVPRYEKLFTERTIWRDIIQKSVNAQDAVIICLYFQGATTEEILNLKKDDVIPNSGTLILNNGKGRERELVVDEKTISLCNQALVQKDYTKFNGNSAAKAQELKVSESDHVVRTVISNTKNEEKSARAALSRRLTALSEDLEFPHLISQNIRDSGMLKMYKDFYIETSGNVLKKQYYKICERFGMNEYGSKDGERKSYNHYPLRTAFLNEKIMKRVYSE